MRVGVEISKANDFSTPVAQGEFTEGLRPMPGSSDLWAARQRPLLFDEIKTCQCELGELCRLETISRPDFCARLARIAAGANRL